jgi:hypothetical protein
LVPLIEGYQVQGFLVLGINDKEGTLSLIIWRLHWLIDGLLGCIGFNGWINQHQVEMIVRTINAVLLMWRVEHIQNLLRLFPRVPKKCIKLGTKKLCPPNKFWLIYFTKYSM